MVWGRNLPHRCQIGRSLGLLVGVDWVNGDEVVVVDMAEGLVVVFGLVVVGVGVVVVEVGEEVVVVVPVTRVRHLE